MIHNDLNLKEWIRRFQVFCLLVALLGVGLAVWRLATRQWPGLPPEKLSPVSVTEAALPTESHFKAMLIPPVDRWLAGQPHSVRLELENDGVEEGVFSGSFETGPESCMSLSPALVKAQTLAAHESQTLDFVVDTSRCTGQLPKTSFLQFRYTWTIAGVPATGVPAQARRTARQPAQSYAGYVSTSAITVTSQNADSIEQFLKIIDSLAKDFTWPVLLAFVGFFSQKALARQGQQQQILNTLLPTLTDLMQNHYLSIVRRMQRITLEADAVKAPITALDIETFVPLKRTFVAIFLMRKRLLYLLNAKGGVFFRSSIAEVIFSDGISAFYGEFQMATGDADLCESIADSLDANALLHVAYAQIFPTWGTNQADPLYRRFAAWAIDGDGNKTAEFVQYLTLLDLCRAVLSFEFDRVFYQTEYDARPIFKNWYFDPPLFEFSGNINDLPASVLAPNVSEDEDMLKLYTLYLNGMPPECRRNVKYPA
jgi:hypothetical protein